MYHGFTFPLKFDLEGTPPPISWLQKANTLTTNKHMQEFELNLSSCHLIIICCVLIICHSLENKQSRTWLFVISTPQWLFWLFSPFSFHVKVDDDQEVYEVVPDEGNGKNEKLKTNFSFCLICYLQKLQFFFATTKMEKFKFCCYFALAYN